MKRKLKPNGRPRAFFKVYLPTSAKRIGIPIAYASYMKGKILQKASLRHQDGKFWPVKVDKIRNDFFFVDGWEKYVKDNSLEGGDFLVFQHDGHRLYDVKLLGKGGIEKNVVEVIEVKEEEKEADDIREEAEDEELLDETEEEGEREVEKVQRGKLGKRVAVGDANSSQRDLKKSKGEKPAEAVRGDRRRIRPRPYYNDIFRSGLVSQPKNPYFVTSVRKKRRNELYVPVDFVRDHNLSLPSLITLHDQHGRKWSSKLTPWKDGRLWYYGGWATLCRMNMVGENDTCICELKTGTDGVHFIQVQIVREDMLLKIWYNN